MGSTACRHAAQPAACGSVPEPRRLRRAARRGFSLLELEVALVVLGIAFLGLYPLAVMYSRGLHALEHRGPMELPDVARTWYLVPSSEVWARKLGACASLISSLPAPKPAPPVLLIDEDDAQGYSETVPDWARGPEPLALRGYRRRHEPWPVGTPITGTDNAIWTFSDIPPGWYRVQATWSEASDQTDAATYTVYDDTTAWTAPPVNQRLAPEGEIAEGRPWQTLVTQYMRSGTVRVELDGLDTAGYVVADGMRLVLVENDVQVLSLERSLNSEEVTVHTSVNVQVP